METTSYPNKYASPKGIFTVGKTKFKWYDLAKNPAEVSPEDIDRAKICIENAKENFQNIEDLGFVIMHRCGENYLLLVCTWRSGKVFIMMETVHLKFGTEIKPTSRLTVYGKWALYTMSLRLGKNTWVLQGMKVIRWNILITCLRVRFR